MIAAGLMAIGAMPSPAAAGTPQPTGHHVAAVFRGAMKGVVYLSELGDGGLRVRVALKGVPTGSTRLVGSSAPCATPVDGSNRVFSLTYQKIAWVRGTAVETLGGHELWDLQTLRLIRPGSPARQLGCQHVEYYSDAAGTSVALELENTLISSYAVAGGTRGIVMAGPMTDDSIRVRIVLQRLDAGATYRVVGSTEPCGSASPPSSKVFSTKVPPGGVVLGISEANALWQLIESIRVVQNGTQETCIQNQIDVLNQLF